ncbi:tripartite tricarboxylate transporter substrate binding protein [Pseudolabrys sp. FHR47]|uniref:Bug family tripartite tricarboxylate transporter substrate binding protein n=1 Tax=Pseudolabrys sp. FHR47 TaxID=2562284 RepID=UPI0010BE7292|nr:tripartite tricarboxylate transporter substrate binding protein [Pseudolabrys sp. FHR47]
MRRVAAFVALLLAMSLNIPPSVQAADWPTRPVRVVVPFGAGSATDVIPRIVFDQVGREIGQQIIVENRGGAGGTIGEAAVAAAEPDGYTFLTTSSAHTIAPALYSKLSYSVADDFATVAAVGSVPNVLIIAPSRGIKTIQDFVKEAKANPGKLTFASLGIGSAVHMSAERFRFSAGYDALHVPFKGGAEALNEVIAGRVDYYFCPIATALPHIKAGKLLALAVSSPTRAPQLPDVPTTLEAGFPNSDYTFWIGTFAPAKTDKAIADKFGAAIAKALSSPEVRAKLEAIGAQPASISREAFDKQVKTELGTYAEFAKKTGMKIN